MRRFTFRHFQILMGLGFLGLLLWSDAAHGADLTISKPGLDMRLQETPCADLPTLAHIPPGLHERALHADIVLDGKRAGGCWFDDGARALVVMNDGSGGSFDKRLFKSPTSL